MKRGIIACAAGIALMAGAIAFAPAAGAGGGYFSFSTPGFSLYIGKPHYYGGRGYGRRYHKRHYGKRHYYGKRRYGKRHYGRPDWLGKPSKRRYHRRGGRYEHREGE